MTGDSELKLKSISSDRIYWTLTILAAALIANPLVLGALLGSDAAPARVSVSDPGFQRFKTVDVRPADDSGKAGSMRSTLQYLEMTQAGYTLGRSPDELRFLFHSPARIHGAHVSVDIHGFDLVEIMVGVNNDPGYSSGREADYILHASYSNTPGRAGALDETIWIPGGMEVGDGDFVGVGGWVSTTTSEETSLFPEVIVFYEWLED